MPPQPDFSLDDEIVRLYTTERQSLSQIAAKLFIGATWVRNALLRNGIMLRGRGGTHHFVPQSEMRRTIALYLHGGPGGHGMTMREVGAEVGLTPGGVWDRLHYAGVSRRTREEQRQLVVARGTTPGTQPDQGDS